MFLYVEELNITEAQTVGISTFCDHDTHTSISMLKAKAERDDALVRSLTRKRYGGSEVGSPYLVWQLQWCYKNECMELQQSNQ